MPLGIRIYSSFIVINTFLETKGILNSIRPGWMDFPLHDAMWLPQIYSSEAYSSAGREEVLTYNTAWHKYTENNQSFFGLIQCCLIRYLLLCATGGLGLNSPKAGFLFVRHWKFLEAFIQVCYFRVAADWIFKNICFDFTHFLPLCHLKILHPQAPWFIVAFLN